MTEYMNHCPNCNVKFSVQWDREDMAPIQHCPYCGYFLQKDKTIEEVYSTDE